MHNKSKIITSNERENFLAIALYLKDTLFNKFDYNVSTSGSTVNKKISRLKKVAQVY